MSAPSAPPLLVVFYLSAGPNMFVKEAIWPLLIF
jgi:hypothetical protein